MYLFDFQEFPSKLRETNNPSMAAFTALHREYLALLSQPRAADNTEKPILAITEVSTVTPPLKLENLQHRDQLLQFMNEYLPLVNEELLREAASAKDDSKEKPIDKVKLYAEWRRGEFGPESFRLYNRAVLILETRINFLAKRFVDCNSDIPPDAPFSRQLSTSGSGFLESEEMFRSRIRRGELNFSLGLKGNDDRPASPENGLVSVLNAASWVRKAEEKRMAAQRFEVAVANTIRLLSLTTISLHGPIRCDVSQTDSAWLLAEKSAQMRVISSTAKRCKRYAESIALLHAYTSDEDRDVNFPGLSDLFRWLNQVPPREFSDEGLKPENFPGEITVGKNGIIEDLKFDLPDSLEPTEENIRRQQRLEDWQNRFGTPVDNLMKLVAANDGDPTSTIMCFHETRFETSKTVTISADLLKLNPHLAGDTTDNLKPIKLSEHEEDWWIKKVDGDRYKLIKLAPQTHRITADELQRVNGHNLKLPLAEFTAVNGPGGEPGWYVRTVLKQPGEAGYILMKPLEPFNLRRGGVTVEECDKEGNLKRGGDYRKITSYREYYWVPSISPGADIGAKSVAKLTAKPLVVHRRGYVPVIEDGHGRVIPAHSLQAWNDAQEQENRFGQISALAADGFMVASGLYTLRAASLAAASGLIGKAAISATYKKGVFEIGLGLSGLGSQFLINDIPGGLSIVHGRDRIMSIQMMSQIAPSVLTRPLFGAPRGMAVLEYFEKYPKLRDRRFFDSVVALANKGAPPAFYVCDMHIIGSATNVLAAIGRHNHYDKVVDVLLNHRAPDNRFRTSFQPTSVEEQKKATASALDRYAAKLGTASSEPLKNLAEVLFSAPDDPRRTQLAEQAFAFFLFAKNDNEAVGAAIVLLSLNESLDPDAPILGSSKSLPLTARGLLVWLKDRSQFSSNLDVRMVAGDALFRMGRSYTIRTAAISESLQTIAHQRIEKPSDPDLQRQEEQLKKRAAETQEYLNAINYFVGDYSRMLMSILRSDASTPTQKMEAIAAPDGSFGLATILEFLRFSDNIFQGDVTDQRELAALYRADADAIEQLLKETAQKGDLNVRTIAALALDANRSRRVLINGQLIAPGQTLTAGSDGEIKVAGEGVQNNHISLHLDSRGSIVVKKQSPDAQVWIIRNNGDADQAVAMSSETATISASDRVILGDRENGAELALATERVPALMYISALVKSAQQKEPVKDELLAGLAKALLADINEQTPVHDRHELMRNKLRAALLANDATLQILSLSQDDGKKAVATALVQCILYGDTDTASGALAMLTPELVNALPPEWSTKLRSHAVTTLATQPGSETAGPQKPAQADLQISSLRMKLLVINALPCIMAGADSEQRDQAAASLECLLLPFGKQLHSQKHPAGRLPSYEQELPNVRVAALKALCEIVPDRATDCSKLLLLGGELRLGEQSTKLGRDPSAEVRLEAVKCFDRTKPWHDLVLDLLRVETDPAVLQQIELLEFVTRPALDPIVVARKVAALRERIDKRAGEQWKEKAEAFALELGGQPGRDRLYRLQTDLNRFYSDVKNGKPLDQTYLTKVALALLHECSRPLAINENDAPEMSHTRMAAEMLEQLCLGYPQQLAPILAGPLEQVLLTQPHIRPHTLSRIVGAYLNLKPGENGVVSRDEAAIVVATILQRTVRDAQSLAIDDSRSFHAISSALNLLSTKLRALNSEVVAPALMALSMDDTVTSLDEKGRPATVRYQNGLSRDFEHDPSGKLISFTEWPAGKKYVCVDEKAKTFQSPDGITYTNPHVEEFGPMMLSDDQLRSSLYRNRPVVRGEFGDFCYQTDIKSYIEKPNGMIIEEELLQNGNRKITYNYPGGKESKTFELSFSRGQTILTTTSHPDGKSRKWTSLPYSTFDRALKFRLTEENGRPAQQPEFLTVPFTFGCGTYFVETGISPTGGGVISMYKSDGSVVNTPITKLTPTLSDFGFSSSIFRQTSAEARQIVADLTQTTQAARLAAISELALAKEQSVDNGFLNATPATLAQHMRTALISPADAHAVMKVLFMAMAAAPLQGPSDPRLKLLCHLCMAEKKNGAVLVAAAQLLLQSSSLEHKQFAIKVLADVAKNTDSPGLRREADTLLNELAKEHAPIVNSARATAVNSPRSDRSAPIMPAADLAIQNQFEAWRRDLLDESFDLQATEHDFIRSLSLHKIPLLPLNDKIKELGQLYSKMPPNADLSWQKEQLKTAARAALHRTCQEIPNELAAIAANPDEPEANRKRARKGLEFIVLSGGTPFIYQDAQISLMREVPTSVSRTGQMTYGQVTLSLDESRAAVEHATTGLVALARDHSPIAAGIDRTLCRLLLSPNLKAPSKLQVIEAMNHLASQPSSLSAEGFTRYLILAFEHELRFGSAGQPVNSPESLAYQMRLLDLIGTVGNAETVPIMTYFATRLNGDLRKKADEVTAKLSKKADDRLQEEVASMLGDIGGKNGYRPIRNSSDPRLKPLRLAASGKDVSNEQAARACEILLSLDNFGVAQDDRKLAATNYTRLLNGDQMSDEQRIRIASHILAFPDSFSNENRQASVSQLARIALSGKPEASLVALYNLKHCQGKDASFAAKCLLEQCVLCAADPASKTRIDQVLTELRRMHLQNIQDRVAGKATMGLLGKELAPLLTTLSNAGHSVATELLAAVPKG